MKATFIAAMALMASVLITACSEKDDFIPEPTPTSVIVTGTVTTSSGKPLADIPVSIDYEETSYLGPHTTIHKAKGKTDSNGRYRLFFEPEGKKSPDGSSTSQSYNLYADLSVLPTSEFIMPADFSDTKEPTYFLAIYDLFDQGDQINIDLRFPKKKELKTELKSFIADKTLEINNAIPFGAQTEILKRNAELDAEGNAVITIPAAVEEKNKISITSPDSFENVCDPQELTVKNEEQTPLVFDNNVTLEASQFRLSLHSVMNFDGKEHGSQTMISRPAPFDFLVFRITSPDGSYDAIDSKRYNYYDSIVWGSPQFPETYTVYKRERKGSALIENYTSQWGSYFLHTGTYKTYLKGYRNGREVCSDYISFELKDRDFLCFDWNECKTTPKPGNTQGIYGTLDGNTEFLVTPPTEKGGTKIVEMRIRFKQNPDKKTMLNWQQIRLEDFLRKHLGQKINYDPASLSGLFKHLPTDGEPGALYENAGTRAIVMLRLPSDYEEECFYIHAESK